MGKALVLKGVNFELNKIETVIIGDIVPCTGLSLSTDTIAFTALGDTLQLIATKTPSNTTDELEWHSSNEDCVTVVDGLVTCVGVGSATITATCGEETATCAVTAVVTIQANSAYDKIDGYGISSTSLSTGKDYCSVASSERSRAYALLTDALDSTYPAFSSNTSVGDHTADEYYPIPVPKGTTKIVFSKPDNLTLFYVELLNSKLKTTSTSPSSAVRNARAMTERVALSTETQEHTYEWDISAYSDYNGLVFSVLLASGYAPSGDTPSVTITFK